MKPAYIPVERSGFIEGRYQRFLKKKEFLSQFICPTVYTLTDLDTVNLFYNKPWKDIILCDRCMADIADNKIIMRGNQYVFHYACLNPDEAKMVVNTGVIMSYDNVINLFEERAKRESKN